MDLIDQSAFGDDQKWIIHLRANEKLSYSQIRAAWSVAHKNTDAEFLSPSALKTCLKRSSLALYWEKGKTYGNEPFLSDPDLTEPQNYIKDHCSENDPVDTTDLLSEALYIRRKRQHNAIEFLKMINCNIISSELE